jgi:hypothetical protein
MKRKPFDTPERPRGWVARNLGTAVKEAERFGFLPCTDGTEFLGIFLSSKLWRLGPLDSERFVAITVRGLTAAYFIPRPFAELWLGILECAMPTGRRRLPQIARAAAARAKAEKTKKRE